MEDLSIIITHYKRPRLLLKLLKKLNGNVRNNLVVVDSKANKGMRVLLEKEFKHILYIPFAKNVGYAKIVNAGLKAAKGKYILILNADIEISPDEIKKILSFLKEHTEAAAIGVTGCFRYPTLHTVLARRTLWGKTRWGKKELGRYEMRDYDREEPCAVDWIRGDCWIVRKSAIQKVGLLDERFFMYLEDADWARRANNAGYKVYYLPHIKTVQHQVGASRQKTLRGLTHRLEHVKSFLKYILKWNA